MREVQVFPTMYTPEAWATVLAALIGAGAALLVLIIQRYLESKANLREQIRQRRAVTRAILVEIDTFYRYHFREPCRFLETVDPFTCELPLIKSLDANPFPVYQGNTGRLGELDEEAAESIIRFYEGAKSQVVTMHTYKGARERYLRDENPDVSEAEARTSLRQMKDVLPELTKLTYLVCSQLCRLTGVPFESPRIAVAAEKLSTEEIARSLQAQVQNDQ